VISEFDKQQLASDTVEIDNYLSQNFIDAVKDKSGLRYVIIQLGAGPQPALYNKVKFNYTGKLLASGTIFFTGTSSPSATFDSRVINYIHGFQAAFTRLPIGTKATLYVPSVLGFGDQSLSAVPANSNLIYEIELIELVE
jgi:FKBP-type peptidyl-prolyl cis-trans isomerase FkpA